MGIIVDKAWELAVPFQKEDAQFAATNGSVVLGHKTGLGKTFISLLAMSMWPKVERVLICGTLGSMSTWWRLLEVWAGITPIFVQGKNDPSFKLCIDKNAKGVYMMTYASFLYGMKALERGKPVFDVLINDELHKTMRTRNQTWEAFKRLDFDHYLGLSATWSSRGPQDLYPVLNLVNRKTFPSYWRFVNTWCFVEDTTWGKEIFGVKNPENLRKMLFSQYYRARTWPEVGSQFRKDASSADPIIRRAEPVPMGKQQTQLIQKLDADMIVELEGSMVVTPNSLALLTRKLQMAISPKLLLPESEFGGPIEWLVEKVIDDPHTVIFCPFREGLDVIEAALKKYGYERGIFKLLGGTKPDDINKTIALWKKSKGVMLCTIAFAQSFPLDTTDTAYMLGFDWDPNNNYQAEGRLRRFDTILQHPCMVTYIVPQGSDYEHVMDVIDGKIHDVRQYLVGYGKSHQKLSGPLL